VTGYWFLDRRDDWHPPSSLANFLASGPPPVYVGFGSLAGWTPDGVVAAAIAALRKTGQRGVLATGGERVPPDLPADVYAIESAPHDWLFPRMAALVHHGGAGTTAEGLRAGKPAVICPTTLNDQAFWGRRVGALGAGPEPVPQRKLTVERLTGAIRAAVGDRGMRERAAELGKEIRVEKGVARAVGIIEGGEQERTRWHDGGGR
jgi:sterol 3beta-glucosyltransferase